jgi:hypothetical protein
MMCASTLDSSLIQVPSSQVTFKFSGLKCHFSTSASRATPSRKVFPQRSPGITGAMRFLVLWQKNRLVRGQGWDRIQNLCVTKSPWREGSECADSPIRILSCSRAPYRVASVVNRRAHGVDSRTAVIVSSLNLFHTLANVQGQGETGSISSNVRVTVLGKKHALTLWSRLQYVVEGRPFTSTLRSRQKGRRGKKVVISMRIELMTLR